MNRSYDLSCVYVRIPHYTLYFPLFLVSFSFCIEKNMKWTNEAFISFSLAMFLRLQHVKILLSLTGTIHSRILSIGCDPHEYTLRANLV